MFNFSNEAIMLFGDFQAEEITNIRDYSVSLGFLLYLTVILNEYSLNNAALILKRL